MDFRKVIGCIGALLLTISLKSAEIKKEAELKTTAQFPGLREEIVDELYTGKVNDTFYLAMEKITEKNIDGWLLFANLENLQIKTKPDKGLNTEGSEFFETALEDYKKGKINQSNEMWVAYASDEPVKGKANLKENNRHIEMYVTVTSSPEALLTSHIGISRTFHANRAINTGKKLKQPDQSIHLHSFGAKVMLLRNPKRVYMITFPAPVMRDILLKKLPPHSIFVGDNLYKKELMLENEQEWESQLKLLKTNPPRIKLTQDCENDKCQNLSFSIKMPTGQQLDFKRDTKIYQWMFSPIFEEEADLSSPYVLIDLQVLAKATKLADQQTK